MARLQAILRLILGRWYVLAVLAAGLGVGAGYLVFYNVFPGQPLIGVIDIPYVVLDDDSGFVIGKMLDYAERNDSIKGVAIRLVTPGGSAATSEELYHKLRRLRDKKPVVISMGWLSASGGMLLSMGANYLYVDPSSFVGSIGVIYSVPEPAAIDERQITSGPAKGTGGSYRTFTEMLEKLKESFIDTVVTERGDRLRMTRQELAEARLYLGLEAVPLGLVDAIGTEVDAIEKAADLAGVSRYGRVDVNEKVLRDLALKDLPIFPSARAEGSATRLPDVSRLRGLGLSRPGGAAPGFPSDVDPPKMYYLYVTPTE